MGYYTSHWNNELVCNEDDYILNSGHVATFKASRKIAGYDVEDTRPLSDCPEPPCSYVTEVREIVIEQLQVFAVNPDGNYVEVTPSEDDMAEINRYCENELYAEVDE